MKDSSLKKNLILIAAAALMLAAALNVNAILSGFFHILNLAMPVILGGIIAFILNVPMKSYERLFTKLNNKINNKIPQQKISSISLLFAIASVFLVITAVSLIAIPEIIASLVGLYDQLVETIPQFSTFISNYFDEEQINEILDMTWIQEQLSSEKITSLISNISSGTIDVVGRLFGFVTSAAGTIFSFFMSFIIAIYMLLYKKKLGMQSRKLIYAYCNKNVADKLCYTGKLINDIYAKFLSGQFIEAFIVAIMLFVAFTIAKLPYAALIAVLADVMSFIPYIGSLLACIFGALLILFISPWQAILSIIVFQIIQFLEGQFIYPHVVGNSVGLPAFYTLLAALLGGSLFGIVGIVFFIPFFAVIYTLIKESASERLKKKGLDDV